MRGRKAHGWRGEVSAIRALYLLRGARPERFELPTTRFEAEYSIQLSYGRLVRVLTDSGGLWMGQSLYSLNLC